MKLLTIKLQTIILILAAIGANAQTPSSAGNTPVTVGAMAPDFSLEDQNGHKVTLTDARSKSPVVLVFYRGYW